MSDSSGSSQQYKLTDAFKLIQLDHQSHAITSQLKVGNRGLRKENTIVNLTKLAKNIIEDATIEQTILDGIAVSESSITSSNASIGGAIITKELAREKLKNLTVESVVTKIFKLIKKLETTKHRRLRLYEFIDMIRDLIYTDVSLVMFNDYQKTIRYYPKDHYFHYYIYFLNYAAYYHQHRCKSNIPDTKQKLFHTHHFKLITEQLNYIHSIIKQNRPT